MHLRYDMYGAYDQGVTEHPQKVMKKLGIKYKASTTQSIADQWWFWGCEGDLENLPEFIRELTAKPEDYGIDLKPIKPSECKHNFKDAEDGSLDKVCTICGVKVMQAAARIKAKANAEVLQPIARTEITINTPQLGKQTVYEDELEEKIKRRLYKSMGVPSSLIGGD